ncbi:GPI-anchored wall transfer protein [Jimgerdemannia flammicorona]|uniref:GPI-anchored wall transfer protein n=1 Tax=Jimgerdemannia flammicorona TaxID=994334 RepID=A0A433QDB1_9FUNG|nr:GPI-anchored wall transfer protein [Jimgerdemannia flammicorona]
MDFTEAEYKRAKERWVSDLSGGSITEINVLAVVLLASYLLWTLLANRSFLLPTTATATTFFQEYLLLTLPILLAMTIAANHLIPFSVALLSASALISVLSAPAPTKETKEPNTSDDAKPAPNQVKNHKPFLSAYRAVMMLMTCASILAVDFPIFPRRFAKVETFGTSLMDLGVGTFVFSSGIVASRAYLRKSAEQTSLPKQLLSAVRSSLPAIILGFARFALTKGVDYQEHVSEYGAHWNFFFTLGFLPPFVTLLAALRPSRVPFGVLGIIVGSAYQFTLYHGLQHYILEHPRVDVVSANKEGICSFVGYLAIFLLGLDAGSYLLQPVASERSRSDSHTLMSQAATFWSLFGLWSYAIAGGGEKTGFEVSRRMVWSLSFLGTRVPNVTHTHPPSLLFLGQPPLHLLGRRL